VSRRQLVWIGLLAALFAIGWWAGRSSATSPPGLYQRLDVFFEVLERVRQNYVDAVDPKPLLEGGIKGMLRSLDPYSQYLDSKSWDNLKATTHGSFGGIGIVVTIRDNYPTIISPVEGSPAWTIGIRSGDVIVKIGEHSAAGLSVEEVADRLRGAVGTPVTLTVSREDEPAPRDYTIVRQIIVTKSVPYSFMTDGRTGYLRLANFSEASGSEVRAAIGKLGSQGATRLVLDLRANPGGLLDQAVDVVEQFVKPNTLVVFTRGRSAGQDNRYYSSERHPQLEWPVVVLVDRGSASAAEIVAGALQDLDRALVVGEVSFGKGSVQSVFPLRGTDAALKLTTALYYTPSGRSIHRNVAQESPDTLFDAFSDEVPADLPPSPTSTDSAAAPRFRTSAGRTVFGGGGIRPDVIVPPDSLPPIARVVETRGLAFRFASRIAKAHAGANVDRVTDREWSDFVAYLKSQSVVVDARQLEGERALLLRALRRELARRAGGDAAAARVALEGDPVFGQAMSVLQKARTPREVFSLAPSTPGNRR
jgi:carboxyl-terminal processing protease